MGVPWALMGNRWYLMDDLWSPTNDLWSAMDSPWPPTSDSWSALAGPLAGAAVGLVVPHITVCRLGAAVEVATDAGVLAHGHLKYRCDGGLGPKFCSPTGRAVIKVADVAPLGKPLRLKS